MPELTTTQLVIIVVLGTVQLGLLLAGLITVARTPKEQLSAPRIVWILICFVQFIGPIVFFVAGRKPKTAAEPPRAAQTGP
ncbi:MAG: PLDc N-terminal domain-containing protein, partial [Brooklawnia sp.]